MGLGDGAAHVAASVRAAAALDALAPRARGGDEADVRSGDAEAAPLLLALPAADWRLLPEMAKC